VKILSHRGYWKSPQEKNSIAAFERSFRLGYGTETDIRDLSGSLVISHDPPQSADALLADIFFRLHHRFDPGLPLALNVKADGLQRLLGEAMGRYSMTNAFVFDMSVPDMLQWAKCGISYYTRHSDLEPEPSCYDRAAGVWLDAFHGDWWDMDVVARHLDNGKQVCVVSPELHGRSREAVWEMLAACSLKNAAGLMICTDFPEDAKRALASDN
jgi:hypothetical protein